MGRGRAKAKQTKVARELKYNSGGTDLERLKAELAGGAPAAPAAAPLDDEDDEFEDPYASDEDDDEDEDDLAAK
ncbi:MAG: hypothetical protein QOJ79_2592 [Actinomycetota bacterium]|jgi:hypothetical protein|nr:hypothetical protein [Actinomycetota bacterium]